VPIYEYECTSCEKRFELNQKMTDPTILTCDQLGCAEAKPVNKIISAPAIMFKGTGWYVTDYSNKLKDPKAGGDHSSAEGKKEGAKETKGEGSSDTKTKTGDSGSGGSTPSTSDSSSSSSSSTSSSSSASSSSSTSGGSGSSSSSSS